MFRVVRSSVISVFVLVALSACSEQGEQQKVVATAGDLEVTLAEFHSAYDKITPNFRPDISTLEGKRDFANDLVNRAILLEEGRRMGGISDPQVRAHLDRSLRNKMLQVLYREEISGKVEVLGRDVAEVYEKRKFNVVGSHILVDTVEKASKIRQDIVSGKTTFEAAAREHSLDQSTRQKGGSFGEVIWSKVMPQFQAYVFENLEVGELSEPFESDIGVHLLRLDARIPQEQLSLEELRPSLRSDVRNQLEGVRMREYVAELAERANVTWHDDAVQLFQQLVEEEMKVDIDTIPPAEHFIPDATPEQREAVLATFSGKDWTIGHHLDFLASRPPANRPVTRLPDAGIKQFIFTTQIQDELLYDEAVAKGFDQRTDVVEDDARLREKIIVELVHGRFLQTADVPEDEVRAFYDSTHAESPELLMIPERVDMLVLVHTDEEVVKNGLARIYAGEPEETVIKELSLDGRTTVNGGRTGLIARGNYAPQIEDVAFSGRAGQGWTEPIVTESGTGAVKVLVHEEPRVATFDEMKDALTRNMAVSRGEAAFEEWLQSERDKRGIEIHDEVLELIGQSVS